jgi:uncharacterized membrane protein (UPF0127 family)
VKRTLPIAIAVLFLLGSCGGEGDFSRPSPTASPTFRQGTAIIDTDSGAVMVRIEVADSPPLQQRGLMGRRSLRDNAGMLFLFFQDTQAGFWMKDTLIPLSIAFFDRGGEILKILDMEPCEVAMCPSYQPGVSYRGALEVNQGAFDAWGVETGDTIRVSP